MTAATQPELTDIDREMRERVRQAIEKADDAAIDFVIREVRAGYGLGHRDGRVASAAMTREQMRKLKAKNRRVEAVLPEMRAMMSRLADAMEAR